MITVYTIKSVKLCGKLTLLLKSVKPDEVPIDTSLLVFIRSHARLVGTKFMCLEGGCGACIVNISGLQSSSGESRSIAVNSVCYLLLFRLKLRLLIFIIFVSVFGRFTQVMVYKLQLLKESEV